LVTKYGRLWSKISKVLVSRNGKQIRDRFINILDPNIKKGKFSLDEDLKLLKMYKKLGPKWATIAKFFENRTADMVKNRFHSSIKKNLQYLEDFEERPFAFGNREFPEFEGLTKIESRDDSRNCIQSFNKSENETISENYEMRRTFDNLTEEKAIDMNYIQLSNSTLNLNANDDIFNSRWEFEDYFIM